MKNERGLEVCIKTRSTSDSHPVKGSDTKPTTVNWSIAYCLNFDLYCLTELKTFHHYHMQESSLVIFSQSSTLQSMKKINSS